jgi:hypothetical protein
MNGMSDFDSMSLRKKMLQLLCNPRKQIQPRYVQLELSSWVLIKHCYRKKPVDFEWRTEQRNENEFYPISNSNNRFSNNVTHTLVVSTEQAVATSFNFLPVIPVPPGMKPQRGHGLLGDLVIETLNNAFTDSGYDSAEEEKNARRRKIEELRQLPNQVSLCHEQVRFFVFVHC